MIGPNGAGKSTLLKAITGEHSPEPGGAVTRAKGVSVGYLPQQPELDPERTAFEAALEGSPRFAQAAAELEQVESSLGAPEVYGNLHALERALARQQTLLEEYSAFGRRHYPAKCASCCWAWACAEADVDKPLGALSGGQKKLVGLARLLLAAATCCCWTNRTITSTCPAKYSWNA